jgi:hypothetical protein
LGDSRVRALSGFEKFLSAVREREGPEILGHGDLMQDVPIVRVSTFPSYGRRT